MGSAKEFLKKMQFVEEMDAGDSEMVADKGHSREMQEDDDVPEATPIVDTDDDQILAVMNNYFKHINALPADQKGEKLQDLTHRMANVMLNMPSGEKELRKALKGAASGLQPIDAAPVGEAAKKGMKKKIGESSEQGDESQSRIDALKKQKDDAKAELDRDPKAGGADSMKSRIADIEKQIQELEAQKKEQSANEAKKPVAKKKK